MTETELRKMVQEFAEATDAYHAFWIFDEKWFCYPRSCEPDDPTHLSKADSILYEEACNRLDVARKAILTYGRQLAHAAQEETGA